jgi:site-specific recombinase XerD
MVRIYFIQDFSHSYASLIANNGGNIMLLSKFLGHSSTKQTLDIYSHLYASEMDSLIDKINKLT